MRRPRFWLRWLFFCALLLLLAQYAALTWLLPNDVVRALERSIGGSLVIGGARLALPLTTALFDLRLAGNTPASSLTIQRAIIRPRGISLPDRTLWVESLEIEQPILRITRTRDGAMIWPWVAAPGPASQVAGASHAAPTRQVWQVPSWRIHVNSVKVVDGVIEFIDEKPATSFHGLVDHLSFSVGPLVIPQEETQISFALHGQFAGVGGNAAPLDCLGWIDLQTDNLEASCKSEPLGLAAFDPYLHGPVEVRVYHSTVKVTSQWIARSNDLKGRIQVDVGHMSEGDVSVHGRTVIDMKRLSGSEEPHVSGELTLAGPLNNPAAWQGAFSPGSDIARQLTDKWLERGVKVVKVPLGMHKIAVRLSPTGEGTMSEVEAAGREVQEALELLATPTPTEAPPAQPAAPVEGQALPVPAGAPGPEPSTASPPSAPGQVVPSGGPGQEQAGASPTGPAPVQAPPAQEPVSPPPSPSAKP